MATKIARCSRGKCRRRPRPEGRYCALCHAAANRRSHRKHRKERNTRRRDRSQNRDEAARARDAARAKLYVAIGRGTTRKGNCVVCQRHDVIAYIADPIRWSEVVWTCREHRSEARTATHTLADAPEIHQREEWLDKREASLAAISQLSKEERQSLYDIAAQGPAGTRLSPESPLFAMRLVRAYQIQVASTRNESNGG